MTTHLVVPRPPHTPVQLPFNEGVELMNLLMNRGEEKYIHVTPDEIGIVFLDMPSIVITMGQSVHLPINAHSTKDFFVISNLGHFALVLVSESSGDILKHLEKMRTQMPIADLASLT